MALSTEQLVALKDLWPDLSVEERRAVTGDLPQIDADAIAAAAAEKALAAVEAKQKADAEAAERTKADEELAAFRAAKAAAAAAGSGPPPSGDAAAERPRYKSGVRFKTLERPADLLGIRADEVAPSYKSFTEDFQNWSDDVYLASRLLHDQGHPADMRGTRMYQDFWGHKAVQADLKALYSTGTGVGDEWVPTEFSPQWLETVKETAKVVPLLRSLPMNTNPQVFPVSGVRTGTMYMQGEATVDNPADWTATDITTAQLSLTAKQFAIRHVYTQEMVEDAVAGAMEYVRSDIAASAAYGLDEATVDGDTTSTHFDTGHSMYSNDRRKAFDGLRHWAYNSGVTVSGASKTWSSAENMVSAKAKMGIYGGDNTVLLCSRSFAAKMGLLRDGANNLIPGVAASDANPAGWGGSRVVISDVILDTYNTAGLYDGSTTSYTELVFFNPDAFYTGWRRGWTVNTEFDIKAGIWNLVMSCRMAFGSPYTVGTHYVANLLYCLLASW